MRPSLDAAIKAEATIKQSEQFVSLGMDQYQCKICGSKWKIDFNAVERGGRFWLPVFSDCSCEAILKGNDWKRGGPEALDRLMERLTSMGSFVVLFEKGNLSRRVQARRKVRCQKCGRTYRIEALKKGGIHIRLSTEL
jgi:DNA-directed RNA polymerase subunit RPC12/RpoP